MGKYLDLIAAQPSYDINDINDKRIAPDSNVAAARNQSGDFGRINRLSRTPQPFASTLAALEARCPERVDVADWQQAVEDGRRFLAHWGEQAAALGWTPRDLFGLAPVPPSPPAGYRRLARYDLTGLVWLLRGRPVAALTKATASIRSATGAVTVFRLHHRPALGPLGDSLEDFR